MSLINRIAGIPEPGQDPSDMQRIPVDFFWAYLYEIAQGKRTQAQLIARFDISVGDQADLTWLIGKYNAQPNATAKAKFIELMRVIFFLTEAREPGYTDSGSLVARINAI